MDFKLLLSIGITVFVCFTPALSQRAHNSPPTVNITAPPENTKFEWNTVVPYAIRVSDPEDGNSEYNEIPANEVFMTVTYLPDSALVKNYLKNGLKSAHQTPKQALLWMSSSTCFTCHSVKAKLIGPSFELIAHRYNDNPVSIDSLAKKIIIGSSGTWGDLKMPPHPELTAYQAREIVRWILNDSCDPDTNYFTGTEGAFRTKEKPMSEPGKAVYVLTASYTDHGTKEVPAAISPSGPPDPAGAIGTTTQDPARTRKSGQHTIIYILKK